MRHTISTLFILSLPWITLLDSCQPNAQQTSVGQTHNQKVSTTQTPHQQLLLVTTSSWDTPNGALQRYIWEDEGGNWNEVGNEIPVLIGKKGLGWGRGLHTSQGLTGPVKKEGDLKSPAGIF